MLLFTEMLPTLPPLICCGQQLPLIYPLLPLGSLPAEGKKAPYIPVQGLQSLLSSVRGGNGIKFKTWLCLASSGTDRSLMKRAWELGKQPNMSHSLC